MSERTIPPAVLVVMGVSGTGKTTIAVELAQRLGWPFQEGDDLHPPENVAKMHAGHPLDDADRWPWLDRVAAWINARLAEPEPADRCGIITCSALRRSYRDRILGARPNVRLLYLTAPEPVLAARLATRTGHYMPASLLASQLATLEVPTAEERPLVIDVTRSPDVVLAATLVALTA